MPSGHAATGASASGAADAEPAGAAAFDVAGLETGAEGMAARAEARAGTELDPVEAAASGAPWEQEHASAHDATAAATERRDTGEPPRNETESVTLDVQRREEFMS